MSETEAPTYPSIAALTRFVQQFSDQPFDRHKESHQIVLVHAIHAIAACTLIIDAANNAMTELGNEPFTMGHIVEPLDMALAFNGDES